MFFRKKKRDYEPDNLLTWIADYVCRYNHRFGYDFGCCPACEEGCDNHSRCETRNDAIVNKKAIRKLRKEHPMKKGQVYKGKECIEYWGGKYIERMCAFFDKDDLYLFNGFYQPDSTPQSWGYGSFSCLNTLVAGRIIGKPVTEFNPTPIKNKNQIIQIRQYEIERDGKSIWPIIKSTRYKSVTIKQQIKNMKNEKDFYGFNF
jgi:hypothetical protein